MNTIRVNDWKEFKHRLDGYAQQPRLRRQQMLFRGQGRTSWKLQTTLDRHKLFSSDADRNVYVSELLDDFRTEAIRVGFPSLKELTGDALELLARHHGLPSPLIDWTDSPYIAAYFALTDPQVSIVEPAVVWVLDKAQFTPDPALIDLIDDDKLLLFNRRAVQQRGSFLRVATILQPTEVLLDAALTKFEIPVSDVQHALADLDSMTINSTNLFCDLDGAAKTAVLRTKS